MSYSAGTAYLQVVPSFRGIEREMRRQLEKLGHDLDKTVGKSLPEAMKGAADKATEKGKESGEDYSGAFAKALRQRLREAFKALPELEIKADSSAADKEIAHIRRELGEIRDQHINLELDDATALAAVELLHRRLKRLQEDVTSVPVHANVSAARSELDKVIKFFEEKQGEIQRRAQLIGRDSGDRFGAEFKSRLQAAVKNLPEIPVNLTTEDADNELFNIRYKLNQLSEQDISVDITDEDALRKLRSLENRLKAIRDTTSDVRMRTNADAALKEINKFFEVIGERNKDLDKEGEKAGAAYGGAFGAVLRKKLTESIDNLPDVEIDADSSEADRKVAAIRERLVALRDKRVGVDIDAEQALAQIVFLEQELDALARNDPTIDVRANTTSARIKLEQLRELVNQLDGQRIDLDSERSSSALSQLSQSISVPISRFGALLAAGAALGPVIVPAAAAAAVAVAAIGTAALAGVSGMAVLGLSLFGVGNAVGALDKYQKDADKSAKSLSGAQNAVASAADSVRNAERSLVNARENAAFANRRAARTVIEAQRSVNEANRDALEAQKALTDAIEDANRANEDRTLRIRDNALAQRQANLDIAEARRELEKILLNPRATQEEREQARITYEQKVLQLDELTVAQKRLQVEQAKANKDGVQGSAQVVAAQERIRVTTQGVADSQQRLADAIESEIRTRRDGAQDILRAQESIIASQRTLQQAYVSSGVAGGEALDNLQEAMKGLSPAGRDFARFLVTLKADFLSLRDAAAEGALPGFQQAITELLPYLPRLNSFIAQVAHGIGELAVAGARGLGSPAWQRLFTFIGDTAVPTLKSLAEIAGNVSSGLIDVFLALTPFNGKIGQGLLDMSEAFAAWAENLQGTQGYRDFLAYVARVGPDILEFFQTLGTFLVRLVIAAAPVGETILHIVDALLSFINVLPIETLTAFLFLLAGLGTTLLVVGGVMKSVELILGLAGIATLAYAKAKDAATAALVRYNATQGVAISLTTRMTTAMGAAAVSSGALAATAGRAALAFGPLGVVIGVAGGLLALFASDAYKASQNVKNLQDAAGQYGKILKDGVTPASAAQARSLVEQNAGLRDLVTTTQALGIASATLVAGLNGDAKARDEITAALERQIQAEKLAASIARGSSDADTKASAAHADRAKQIEAIKEAFVRQNLSAAQANALLEQLYGTTTKFTGAAAALQPKIDALQQLYNVLSQETINATDASKAYRDVINAVTEDTINAVEAEERAIRTSLDYTKALNVNGLGLDLKKAKTEAETRAILENRDALQAALLASREKLLADIAAKVPIDEATAAHRKRIEALLAEIPQGERNTKVVRDLVTAYGDIPGDVTTKVKISGIREVYNQLVDAMIAQKALQEGISPEAAASKYRSTFSPPPREYYDFKAEGGKIYGPGTKTSDSVPIMASAGEFMQRAAAVDYYGVPFMDALNRRRIPKGLLPGFANGGHVTWPYEVTARNAHIPNYRTAIREQAAYDAGPGLSPWPSSPGAQRGDSGVWKSIVAIIRSTGPVSGSFGNAYRPGDPLWHGSGRAVDWMGYNQDQLAGTLAGLRPLELIHRTNTRDYAYTRGKNRGSFNQQLMNEHRNHIHVAMRDGGLVKYDSGGYIPPGLSTVYNGTGRPEPVLTGRQWDDINVVANAGGGGMGTSYNFAFQKTDLTVGRLRAMQDRDAALARSGRAR